MANINQVQLPDGSQYNIKDSNSGYATETYVQNQISAIDKTTVGLGNVDNTSDANKPVSTAQQTALDGKVNTSMVAHVQTTLTADMRYLVGDEFIYQGNLYKATAIIPNGDAITIGTNASLADDITTQIGNANAAIGTLNTTVATKANKADLTNLDLTGTTNSTGSTIAAGTYFYLNGTLVRAKTAIASGATFTLNTNYEIISNGALNPIEVNVSSLVSKAVANTGTIDRAVRIGNRIEISFSSCKMTANTYGTLINIDDSIKPKSSFYFTGIYPSGSFQAPCGIIAYPNVSGGVIYCAVGQNVAISGSVVYWI